MSIKRYPQSSKPRTRIKLAQVESTNLEMLHVSGNMKQLAIASFFIEVVTLPINFAMLMLLSFGLKLLVQSTDRVG